jgi:hypothetical protein
MAKLDSRFSKAVGLGRNDIAFIVGSDILRPRRSSPTPDNFVKLVTVKGNLRLLDENWLFLMGRGWTINDRAMSDLSVIILGIERKRKFSFFLADMFGKRTIIRKFLGKSETILVFILVVI